jgi:peptidyl-prolyl cis-trans isomerase C
MPDPDRPQLSLGQPPGELKTRMSPMPRSWLRLLLALQVVIFLGVAALWWRPAVLSGSAPAGQAAGNPDDLKQAALELEERGLDAQAARAWQDYLAADPETAERADVLYRVGELYIQAEKFDDAAAALVRAELAAGDDHDLRAKIGPKLVECFRHLGRYGEVGRELSRQVEAGAQATGKGKVLATLDGEPLTEADLDRMIERQVDRVLAVQGASQDEAARQTILRQLSTPDARRQMLQQLIQTELFCRRARELKLDRDEEFLQARQQVEEDLLANRFLARELDKIRPTEVDVQSYYKANQERYREPETAQVRVIPLKADDDAAKLLAAIQSADDFRKLAAERASPDANGGGPQPRTVVRGRPDPLLGDVESLFKLAKGEWTREPIVQGDHRFLVLVEKKTAARTPPLTEIGSQVEADYAQLKQQELRQELAGDLMRRYDVRIMPPGNETKEPAESASGKQGTQGKEGPPANGGASKTEAHAAKPDGTSARPDGAGTP